MIVIKSAIKQTSKKSQVNDKMNVHAMLIGYILTQVLLWWEHQRQISFRLECQAFSEADVSLSTSNQVLVYPKLQLKETNRIICAESMARSNNSCVHISGNIYSLVNKIILLEGIGCYIVVSCQNIYSSVTNAEVKHIKVFDSPRYVVFATVVWLGKKSQ